MKFLKEYFAPLFDRNLMATALKVIVVVGSILYQFDKCLLQIVRVLLRSHNE
ncbi:hypothetical protein [Dapis sp. BLCC M172]|uniref:hypothetical protein n=1 Tax=Dapis sp. BLCC M172 TaxID=2975281 RepID=UPI003CED74EF